MLGPVLLCEVLGRERKLSTRIRIQSQTKEGGLLLKLHANEHEKNQDVIN